MQMAEISNVGVVVRVRPLTKSEKTKGATIVVGIEEEKILVSMNSKSQSFKFKRRKQCPGKEGTSMDAPQYHKAPARQFLFDCCYHLASQDKIFEDIGSKVLEAAFDGYNTCVLAYGQSGSGKTFTMMGHKGDPGLIPRICKGLFDRMREKSEIDKHFTFNVKISFVEIYNEKVVDLLKEGSSVSSRQRKQCNLRVREHPKFGPCVQDLSRHSVTDFQSVQSLIERGIRRRSVAATRMHDRSSRSHAIFTIDFTQISVSEDMPSEVVSKIHLVDLAGSERATIGMNETRLKEGANINKSLVTLGSVISSLAEKCMSESDKKDGLAMNTTPVFVSYRNSVLTWLLKESLGGNSKTYLVATISPASIAVNETLSTLRYAQRAKCIVNKPIVNEDPNMKLIRELKVEIIRLQRELYTQQTPNKKIENQFEDFSPVSNRQHESLLAFMSPALNWCSTFPIHQFGIESTISLPSIINIYLLAGVPQMVSQLNPYTWTALQTLPNPLLSSAMQPLQPKQTSSDNLYTETNFHEVSFPNIEITKIKSDSSTDDDYEDLDHNLHLCQSVNYSHNVKSFKRKLCQSGRYRATRKPYPRYWSSLRACSSEEDPPVSVNCKINCSNHQKVDLRNQRRKKCKKLLATNRLLTNSQSLTSIVNAASSSSSWSYSIKRQPDEQDNNSKMTCQRRMPADDNCSLTMAYMGPEWGSNETILDQASSPLHSTWTSSIEDDSFDDLRLDSSVTSSQSRMNASFKDAPVNQTIPNELPDVLLDGIENLMASKANVQQSIHNRDLQTCQESNERHLSDSGFLTSRSTFDTSTCTELLDVRDISSSGSFTLQRRDSFCQTYDASLNTNAVKCQTDPICCTMSTQTIPLPVDAGTQTNCNISIVVGSKNSESVDACNGKDAIMKTLEKQSKIVPIIYNEEVTDKQSLSQQEYLLGTWNESSKSQSSSTIEIVDQSELTDFHNCNTKLRTKFKNRHRRCQQCDTFKTNVLAELQSADVGQNKLNQSDYDSDDDNIYKKLPSTNRCQLQIQEQQSCNQNSSIDVDNFNYKDIDVLSLLRECRIVRRKARLEIALSRKRGALRITTGSGANN